MQLTVKTLKGGKFTVDAELSNTIAEVKGIIETSNKELPAASMKLIHSGKVLKDDQKVEECNIKPNDFLVVMITKAKKPVAAPAPTPAASSSATPATPASAAAASGEAPTAPATTTPAATGTAAPVAPTKATEAEATTTTTTTTATPTPATPAATTDSPAAADDFPAEVIANLTGMGFPEAEVKACLRASRGDPNVAVEFLMNGIPPGMENGGGAPATGATAGSSGNPLDQLRNHPQFNALKRLVQTNPSMLQQVLSQIGQQDPTLLQAINANQAGFLEMMNEPVDESAAPPAPPSGGNAGGAGGSGGGAADMANNLMAGGMMADPAQMSQLISSLSPTELADMARMMGLSPQQLQATAQMIQSMPPEQLQDFMMQAMQQGGGLGGGGGAGGPGGPVAIRLTPEEQASIQRLVDMGFDRAEATQAYLACDKNEALAANLLMDGGFGFGDDGGDGGGDDAGDDMYD